MSHSTHTHRSGDSQATPVHVDLAVAKKILRGDGLAFRRLFDNFYPRLYRFALARLNGDTDAAGDIAQQTFCKAVEKLDTYRGDAALFTWFCQICRNLVVDYIRARGRERKAIVPIQDLPEIRAVLEAMAAPTNEQPLTEFWRRDICGLVHATVDTLPDRYGAVLEWKYVDGLTVAEIAHRLDITIKAAESLLNRARQAFRRAIETLVDGVADDIMTPPEAVAR